MPPTRQPLAWKGTEGRSSSSAQQWARRPRPQRADIPLKGGGFNSASRLRSLSVLVGTDRVYELKNRILFEY